MFFDFVLFNDFELLGKYAKLFGENGFFVPCLVNKDLESDFSFYSFSFVSKKDSGKLRVLKSSFDALVVNGSSLELVSWAANQKSVDAVFQPFSFENSYLDLSTANVLARNNVFVIIPFEPFLCCSGFKRSQLLKNASFVLKILEKAGVNFLLVSGASKEENLRSVENLVSFGVMLGLSRDKAFRVVKRGFDLFLSEKVKK